MIRDVTSLDARILLTCGHFVATCLAASARGMHGGVAFFVFVSFGVALVSVVAGWELFASRKNAAHAVTHFVGGLLQARLVLYDALPRSYQWYAVVVTHLPATLVSLSSFIAARRKRNSPP